MVLWKVNCCRNFDFHKRTYFISCCFLLLDPTILSSLFSFGKIREDHCVFLFGGGTHPQSSPDGVESMAVFESRGIPGQNWFREGYDNGTKRLQGTCLFQQAIYNIYRENRQTHYDVGAILWVRGA